jgi:hypothetical protein
LPKALKEAKVKRVNTCSARRRMFLSCGGEMRDVWMLSTRHIAQTTKTSNRQGKEKMKPLAVVDDKHKAGVDLFD